jgi:adenylate cyclase
MGEPVQTPRRRADDQKRLGLRRSQWKTLAYAVIVINQVVGFFMLDGAISELDKNQAADLTRAIQAEIDDDYQTCLRGNDSRAITREVVILATEGNGIDLTGVSGFERLEPEVQAFLVNLRDETTNANGEDDPDSFRNRALATLTIRNCEREFPHASDLQ